MNSAAQDAGATLGYSEALDSPCRDCPEAPCCTRLPLHTFQLGTLLELDHALYALNFEHIELGLSASGEWGVYYRRACRNLDPRDRSCTVHDSPEQPRICVHYNPYHCWYKRAFGAGADGDYLRIDRARMEWILPRLRFDDSRRLVAVPSWDEMEAAFQRLPLEPDPDDHEAVPPDPASELWQEWVLIGAPSDDAEAPAQGFGELGDPCAGCDAPCCTTLLFPQAAPATASSLDYLRFALGFPGVEVGVTDGEWSLVVRSRCRHRRAEGCGVYGKPERPLICRYYDAWKCTYREQFGRSRPAGFLRVRQEHFPWLAECFRFAEDGGMVDRMPVETMREHVERRWRQSLQDTTNPEREGEQP